MKFQSLKPQTEKAKRRSGCLFLFAGVFVVFGLAAIVFFSLIPIVKSLGARQWDRVPAVVLDKGIDTRSDSDGSTYKVWVKFRYRVQGREFESDTLDFQNFYTGSWDAAHEKQEPFDIGQEVLAYVNPRNPREAVLSTALSWTYGIGWLVGGIFVVAGVFMMTSSRRSRLGPSKERTSGPETFAPGPVVLKSRTGGPVWRFVGILIFTVLWTGAVVLLFKKEAPLPFKMGFLFFNVLLGVGCGYSFLALFNPRLWVEVSRSSVPLGGSVDVHWRLKGRVRQGEEMTCRLIGQEVATYRRGTNTVTVREPFFDKTLVRRQPGEMIMEGRQRVDVPAESMYSWRGGHNAIVWFLKFQMKISQWPDVIEEYTLNVAPRERPF